MGAEAVPAHGEEEESALKKRGEELYCHSLGTVLLVVERGARWWLHSTACEAPRDLLLRSLAPSLFQADPYRPPRRRSKACARAARVYSSSEEGRTRGVHWSLLGCVSSRSALQPPLDLLLLPLLFSQVLTTSSAGPLPFFFSSSASMVAFPSFGRKSTGPNNSKFTKFSSGLDFSDGRPPNFSVPLTPPPNALAEIAAARPLRKNEQEQTRLQGLMRTNTVRNGEVAGAPGEGASRWEGIRAWMVNEGAFRFEVGRRGGG